MALLFVWQFVQSFFMSNELKAQYAQQYQQKSTIEEEEDDIFSWFAKAAREKKWHFVQIDPTFLELSEKSVLSFFKCGQNFCWAFFSEVEHMIYFLLTNSSISSPEFQDITM